uniref:hypothetical protein n=1 Tax=Yoonia sp. TaxID=2212373 RepID=UPI0040482EF4
FHGQPSSSPGWAHSAMRVSPPTRIAPFIYERRKRTALGDDPRRRRSASHQQPGGGCQSRRSKEMATRVNTDTGVVETDDNFFGIWVPKED